MITVLRCLRCDRLRPASEFIESFDVGLCYRCFTDGKKIDAPKNMIRCSSCGFYKFKAYFYSRKDRRAPHQPCRSCAKFDSAMRYRMSLKKGGNRSDDTDSSPRFKKEVIKVG